MVAMACMELSGGALLYPDKSSVYVYSYAGLVRSKRDKSFLLLSKSCYK